MCRLIACGAGTKRDEAIYMLRDMLKDNTDGVGYSYVDNQNGRIITHKWGLSLNKVLKIYNKNFLNHMPHDAFTIIHLRKASTGGTLNKCNAHPFEIGGEIGNPRMSVIHNGFFKEHEIVRLALEKFVDFKSDNDSEVGAQLINLCGFEKFNQTTDWNGVFMGLNKDNTLSISKTSKELETFTYADGRLIISSEFPTEYIKDSKFVFQGFYKYDKAGKCIIKKEKAFTTGKIWKYNDKIASFRQSKKEYPNYDHEAWAG